MPDRVPVRRALLSVSDKTGLVDLARGLASLGVELVSTGGTARALREAGLAVRDVADLTGFPEMMDGRVKTLHPRVHGALLGRREIPEHAEAAAQAGIAWIDLVVVNLYPFEATITKPGVTREEAIEQIDIGGPSMLRSAAKNADWVGVLTDPDQYGAALEEIRQEKGLSGATRRRLALGAFRMTVTYAAAIARHLGAAETVEPLPESLPVGLKRLQALRYGENPHQAGALYAWGGAPRGTVAGATVLGGKELSYNNLLDADAAWGLASDLPRPAAVIVKHLTPCGAATSPDLAEAFRGALAGDPVSAFGGIVAVNTPLDEATALAMAEDGNFFEVIVAPAFSPAARDLFLKGAKWRAKVRLLETGGALAPSVAPVLRSISGGVLAQSPDISTETPSAWELKTGEMTPSERADADLAWRIVKHVKSNAIVMVADGRLAGVGTGQMNRLDSVDLAGRHAQAVAPEAVKARRLVMASDAFFPFKDGIERAAACGVRAVVQPGGSIRDAEVVEAAARLGMAMAFTGIRHFRH